MRKLARLVVMAAALSALSPLASAYYYWVFFATRTTPFVPVPARFDLNSLQNSTVTYLISDQGPAPLVQGDSFTAVISQIRAAADVWSNVKSSAIRLAFGGLSPMTTPSASPEIDVVFDDGDIPPGLLALTIPSFSQNATALVAGGANFVPIVRSKVILHKDLTNAKVFGNGGIASYQDSFFLTVVHEFGHALGLQHTDTGSAMSTQITRGTTKAAPLTADDIAGISMLYPVNGFQASTGSITGRVSLSGSGVNMAGVIALSTTGAAVSALTNPDGTYRIDGIPPGQYYVYAHPLAPAYQGESYPDNIIPPQDIQGNVYAANTQFGGQFFGGTTDWTQAAQVNVVAGAVSDSVHFNVQKRNGPAAYGMQLYGYLGAAQTPVQAPPLQAGGRTQLAFLASSVTTSNGYLPFSSGLNVSTIGGAAPVEAGNTRPFPGADPYMLMVVDPSATISQATPVAVAINVNNDVYVLPNAFSVVPSGLPVISGVTGSTDAQGNATVTITGSNLAQNTRILFDGAAAKSATVNGDGSLTVTAPPAAGGYQAAVEALTADGQTSSLALGSAPPPTFTYGGPAFPSIRVNQPSAAAGTDALIDVIGNNTNFVDGQTVVGFGSSDVVVKKIWVVSPGWVRMNVSVNAGATPGTTTVSVASGLQLATLTASFQITPAVAGQVTMRAPILNHSTHLPGIPAGGTAEINTSGLPSNTAGWSVSIANQTVPITIDGNGQILALVPVAVLPGPVEVHLSGPNGASAPPLLLQVDPAPPAILSVTGGFGVAVAATLPAQQGATITVNVSGMLDSFGNLPPLSSVAVEFGSVEQPALLLTQNGNNVAVQAAIPAGTPSGEVQIAIRVDTRVSAPFSIFVQ